jgi:glycosyltransferase involved in cell wall biosynthesis
MVGVIRHRRHAPCVDEARAARRLPNLEVRGHVEHGRVAELFQDAALFVQTSTVEGFPNTLLESWAHGVPSVSAFDPDGVIARHGLGQSVETLYQLESAVLRWMVNPGAREQAGHAARAYVETHHAPFAVIARVAALFDRLIATRGRLRARVALVDSAKAS